MVNEFEARRSEIVCSKRLRVAMMGCVVNGPGEAREADVGIAGGRGEGLVFRKGQILEKLPESELIPRLIREIKEIQQENYKE